MKRFFYSIMVFILVFTTFPAIPASAAATFNYGEALQKSILFYEQQRSGFLSKSDIPTRVLWRGDAQTADGQDVGLDLTGGWVDAGDNMKYNITNAAAATFLAWGAIEYRQAYEKSGQLKWLINQLKWINDFFIKCHPEPNVFYGQIGMTKSDHDNWIPIESSQFVTDRKAIRLDPENPATDLVLEVAAAMAASSMVFRPTDPTYANTLLTHAEQLFAFGDKYRGTYFDTIKKIDAATPYQSWSGISDELVWGPAWIYKAKEAKETGSGSSYLAKAEANYSGLGNEKDQKVHKYKWTHNYDDATFGCYVLMSQLKPGNADYKADVERWLNWWTIGGSEYGADGTKVKYTPGGHARLDEWGSFRYAANTSLLAFIYSDKLSDTAKKARYHDFAVEQINYILGQNPRNASYIVGFGTNSPQHPHHRSAHGAWGRKDDTPSDHRHILYGALVGSPTSDDKFNDSITDYVANEVAVDYNAGITGALARMYQEFGGTPMPDSSFPLPDKVHEPKDEWPVFVKTYWQGQGGMQLSFTVENRSCWPSRPSDKLRIKYFFTLDAADPGDITTSLGSSTMGPKITPKISGPTLWDASKKVYYVTVDLTGEMIYPGYMWSFGGPEVILNINSKSNNWLSSNDWSFQNWDAAYISGDRKFAPNIPMYEVNTKLQGNEPSGGPSNTPIPSVTPTKSSTGHKVSGYIAPDFTAVQPALSIVKSGFTVKIGGLDVKTDSAGYFEIDNVPAFPTGTSIKIIKPGFLSMEKTITIASDKKLSSETSPLLMWAGDITRNGNQDGAINMSDIIELAKGFGSVKGDLKYSLEYDFNQDNSVNMNDVIIIAKHFNAISSDYPEINQP
ncbi:MAG TPA: glycoside hydrolase family 9 protein [Pseudobacteroides sp.]|uniref:glycoside hydrolase family 9 protein n=1 Tax=Pseudobacteroides sp. TaxID=1968840 RepID=UPI002F93FF41